MLSATVLPRGKVAERDRGTWSFDTRAYLV